MNPASRIRIRWRIFGFLFGFGFIAYLQQKSITVAAAPMMPDLGLTQLQIGWLEQGFTVGYAAFQIPVGIFAERWGARGALVLMGLVAVAAMIATPLAPALFAGSALFACLLCLQVLLGMSQAATFPVSAGVFQQWFRPNRWASVMLAIARSHAVGKPVWKMAMQCVPHHLQPGLAARLGWSSYPGIGYPEAFGRDQNARRADTG